MWATARVAPTISYYSVFYRFPKSPPAFFKSPPPFHQKPACFLKLLSELFLFALRPFFIYSPSFFYLLSDHFLFTLRAFFKSSKRFISVTKSCRNTEINSFWLLLATFYKYYHIFTFHIQFLTFSAKKMPLFKKHKKGKKKLQKAIKKHQKAIILIFQRKHWLILCRRKEKEWKSKEILFVMCPHTNYFNYIIVYFINKSMFDIYST
jgi:hypothetical protein